MEGDVHPTCSFLVCRLHCRARSRRRSLGPICLHLLVTCRDRPRRKEEEEGEDGDGVIGKNIEYARACAWMEAGHGGMRPTSTRNVAA